MLTDTERREVARRLRALDDSELQVYDMTYFAIQSAVGGGGDQYPDGRELADRLADLIEPNRGSGVRTILCAHCEKTLWCGCEPGDEEGGCDFEPSVTEGEPPYNLYSLYEAVLRRHPRDEYAIEDDEVDELVDALLDICNAPGHDVIQKPQPGCDRDALLALASSMSVRRSWLSATDAERGKAIARRIREACGVVDAG